MKASNVTDLLFNKLSYASENQKVISSNLANINTPNYKTKKLVFEDEVKKMNDSSFQLKTTNSKHISSSSNINPYNNSYKVVEEKGLTEQNDGNNVNLDQQMSEMSKNSIMTSALQQSIKKDSRLFRSVIDSSSKN